MSKQSHEHNHDSLEEVARDLSASLSHERIDVHNTSVGELQGGQISMTKSAARSIRANAMNMDDSAAVSVRADSLEMRDCATAAVVSNEAVMQDSNATFVASGSCKTENVNVGLLIAGRVEGDVKAVLTPLGALAFGLGVGMAVSLLQGVTRRLRTGGR